VETQSKAAQLTAPRYARAKRLAEIFNVSVATIWRWSANGRIPGPIKFSPGVTAWKIDAVEAALRARDHV